VALSQANPVSAIERSVVNGIREGVYPGAVVVIGTKDTVLWSRGYGHFTWSPASAVPDPDSTLFDLASLTKVVATSGAAMLLVQEGRLDLDRALQAYLPEFAGPGKDRVTVRHLLEHRSGLRAFLPLNRLTASAEEAKARVLAEQLRLDPGGQVVYSDLNAMLLGWVVELVAEMPLDRYVEERLFPAMGMVSTRFRPPRTLRPRIMPVGLWRGHAIAGEVHDQNAARLGGVAGHAGLYSTGHDLAKLAQTLLRGGLTSGGQELFTPGVVRHFTRRGSGNRALGWEVRDTTTAEQTGSSLSAAAYGHGGFTGTSIWVDPDRDLFVIVLTNRVFAPRTGSSITKLKRIRGEVADQAVQLRHEWCRTRPAETIDRCE
jgi:CubicO group peptidase (beta-lactamase class C family)